MDLLIALRAGLLSIIPLIKLTASSRSSAPSPSASAAANQVSNSPSFHSHIYPKCFNTPLASSLLCFFVIAPKAFLSMLFHTSSTATFIAAMPKSSATSFFWESFDSCTAVYGGYLGSKSSGCSLLACFIALTNSFSSAFLSACLPGVSAYKAFYSSSLALDLAALRFSFSVMWCTVSLSSSLAIFTESLCLAPLGAFFGNSYSFATFSFLFFSAIWSLSSACSCSGDFTRPSAMAYARSSATSRSYFALAFNFFSFSLLSTMLAAIFLSVLLL